MEENGARVGKRKRSEDSVYKNLKTDSTQGSDFINYFSEPPSLQRISAVTIAIKLWANYNIRREVTNSLFSGSTDLSELEEGILESLSCSSLPMSLKTEVSYVIPPIRLELSKTLCSYCRCIGYSKKICEYFKKGGQIFWTVEGTIDIRKSLIELINSENSENDIACLYEAACLYCLEEYVSELWKKIPVQIKNQYRTGRLGDTYKYHIVLYWTSVLENDLDNFLSKVRNIDFNDIYDPDLSIDLNMMTCSINSCNIFALKYFWKKLSEPEKNENLNKWLLQASQVLKSTHGEVYEKYIESLDVLCFLLSRVNSKIQLTEFFQDNSHVLALLLVKWPFQRVFLPTILETLDNLPEDAYVFIMGEICSELSEKGIERKIFKEIWGASPPRLKRSILQDKKVSAQVLIDLLAIDDLDMALLFINDASEKEMKQIICYLFGWLKFCFYIQTMDLKLLNRLLSETTLPPECILPTFRFNNEERELYDVHNQWHLCYEWIIKGNFQVADAFLKWAFQSADELQDFKKTKLDPHLIFASIVITCDYKRIEQFLNWYFSSDEEIHQFKKDFIHDNNNSHFKFLLSELCSRLDIAWNVLERFLSSYLSSPEEIAELKSICLNYVETVLLKKHYEFATMLLNLSLEGADKVKQYKNEFMLSEKGIKKSLFFKKLRNTNREWKDLENLIKWSLPLYKETISELKTLFGTEDPFYSSDCESKLQVIALLDSLAENESTPELVKCESSPSK